MLEILQYAILLIIDLFPIVYHPHIHENSLECAYDKLLTDTCRCGAYDLQYILVK